MSAAAPRNERPCLRRRSRNRFAVVGVEGMPPGYGLLPHLATVSNRIFKPTTCVNARWLPDQTSLEHYTPRSPECGLRSCGHSSNAPSIEAAHDFRVEIHAASVVTNNVLGGCCFTSSASAPLHTSPDGLAIDRTQTRACPSFVLVPAGSMVKAGSQMTRYVLICPRCVCP